MKRCQKCKTIIKRGHRTIEQLILAKFCSIKCMSSYRIGSKHPMWKGMTASYSAIHHWIKRVLGTPDKCDHCGNTNLKGRKIHWANISGKYKRIKGDWKRLCVPCHSKFDKTWLKRNRNINGQFKKTKKTS